MGFQASMMFCENKRDVRRLCNLLNKAAADEKNGLEAWGMDIFSVSRLKKDLVCAEPYWNLWEYIIPKGSYFVWWGGERGAQRDDNFLKNRAHRGDEWTPYWDTVYNDYIPWEEMLTGVVEDYSKGAPGKVHENDWMRVFFPEDDNLISMDLIDQL